MTLVSFLKANNFHYIEFFDNWDRPIFNGWITRIDLEHLMATCPSLGYLEVVEKPYENPYYKKVYLLDYISPSIEGLMKGLYCF